MALPMEPTEPERMLTAVVRKEDAVLKSYQSIQVLVLAGTSAELP